MNTYIMITITFAILVAVLALTLFTLIGYRPEKKPRKWRTLNDESAR